MPIFLLSFLKSKIGLALMVGVILGTSLWVKSIQLKESRADIVMLEATQATLQNAITKQNDHIESLKKRADAEVKQAELAALRRLREADKLRALLAEQKAGPEVMNQWLKRVFQ